LTVQREQTPAGPRRSPVRPPLTPGLVTRLLAAAGHVEYVPAPARARKDSPAPRDGFRVLSCGDGSVYVTWYAAVRVPYEPTPKEVSLALVNASAYADVLVKAGYRAEIAGVIYHSAQVFPPHAAGVAPAA
jgi:hypothetical protein